MKKFALTLMGTIAAVAMPLAAQAQTFSAITGSTVTGNGEANLSQTITVTCDVSFTGSVSSSTISISSRSISPGDFNCIFVGPQGTWSAAVVPGDATKVDLTLGANTVAGKPCFGTVRGDWDNTSKLLTITNKTLPPVTAGDPNCTINSATIEVPNLNLS